MTTSRIIVLTTLILTATLANPTWARVDYPPLLFHAHGTAEDPLGMMVTGIGDQNGDGYNDILVTQGFNWTRQAHLFLGGDSMDTEPDFTWTIPGLKVTNLDDIDGDSIF